MTYWSSVLGFSAASFVIAISPGPSWIYVISTTLRQDANAGRIAVLGNAVGIAIHVVAAACGLSALLSVSAMAYAAVKFAGASYLVYLGIRMIRRPVALLEIETPASGIRHRTIFCEALLVSLLNPKLAVLMLALLPQFINPARGNVAYQTLGIGSLHILIATVVLATVVQLSSHSAKIFQPSMKFRTVMRYLGGCFLIALGIRVAIAARP